MWNFSRSSAGNPPALGFDDGQRACTRRKAPQWPFASKARPRLPSMRRRVSSTSSGGQKGLCTLLGRQDKGARASTLPRPSPPVVERPAKGIPGSRKSVLLPKRQEQPLPQSSPSCLIRSRRAKLPIPQTASPADPPPENGNVLRQLPHCGEPKPHRVENRSRRSPAEAPRTDNEPTPSLSYHLPSARTPGAYALFIARRAGLADKRVRGERMRDFAERLVSAVISASVLSGREGSGQWLDRRRAWASLLV